MTYWTTTLAVVAGLCFAFALLLGFVAVGRPHDRTRNAWFAAFAASYGAAVLAARAGYTATSGDDHITAAQVTGVFAGPAWVALLWFVATSTGFRPQRLLAVLTVLFASGAFVSAVSPDLLVGDADDVTTIELPWGEEVLSLSGDDAGLAPLITLGLLVALAYLVTATVRQYRRGERRAATFLGIGIGWFIGTITVDLLVSVGVFEFVFLSDVGFVGFVIAFSLEFTQSMIDTERDLRAYQSDLEALVEQRTVELRGVQAELIAEAARQAATDERSRLARELHDQVTQTLFSVNLIASSLPRLFRDDPPQAERSTAELHRLTRGAMAEMRTLLRELRPQTITDTDLHTLLDQLVEGVATRHDLDCDVTVEMVQRVEPDVHLSLYRIAQEAVTNIAKHADADKVTVTLDGDEHHVHLRITDDGTGFDPAAVHNNGSMGLGIMRERAEAIGAALTVEAAAGAGTSIAVGWTDAGERDSG